MPFEPAQIELHLPLVGGRKLADLEIDDDKPAQRAMVKKQVDVVIFVVDDDALLPGNEGEAGAQFEDESLHLAQDGAFEILFAVGVGQAEKIEEIRVAKNQVGRQRVFLAQGLQLLPGQLGGLPRESR